MASGALCAVLLCGCFDGPREAVEAAIAAASAEDEEAMIEHLDERSAELVRRVRSEGEDVPDRWRWMRGRPTALLANLVVTGIEEVGDHTAKASLEGSALGLREVWVLKGGSKLRPKWRVHFLGSGAVYDRLRLEGD
jgi:hypothetical protein